VSGEVYNIGGGPDNTLSLLELVSILKEEGVMKTDPGFTDWRPGDQNIFICDLNKIENHLGWKPSTSPKEGVRELISWSIDNKKQLQTLLS
jgi:CDP-paratose 2-epimerase